MDFDFDQGLLDAYSDIFAQINPNDFPDWEGDVSKEVKSEERIDCSDLGRVFPVEELEEEEVLGVEQLNAQILFWVIDII